MLDKRQHCRCYSYMIEFTSFNWNRLVAFDMWSSPHVSTTPRSRYKIGAIPTPLLAVCWRGHCLQDPLEGAGRVCVVGGALLGWGCTGDTLSLHNSRGSEWRSDVAILYPRHPDAVSSFFLFLRALFRFRGWSMHSFRMFLRVFHSGESSGRVLGSGPSHL